MDKYGVHSVLLCPSHVGNPMTRRRLYSVLYRKTTVGFLGFGEDFHSFCRGTTLTGDAFLVATDDDLEVECLMLNQLELQRTKTLQQNSATRLRTSCRTMGVVFIL